MRTEIAVVGAGPAGLSAACAASEAGARVIVIDEQSLPGGQLTKQTYRLFGSNGHVAGVRSFRIGRLLRDRATQGGAEISVATKVIGIQQGLALDVVRDGQVSRIEANRIIVATGADEEGWPFPGRDLPGVMNAAAAQALGNLQHGLSGRRVLTVGSGNPGLIISYQLLQADAEVVALIEALPYIRGYWVRAATLRRAGVPILIRHTVLEARGDHHLAEVMIAEVDETSTPKPGTERKLEVDTICLAPGLSPSTLLTSVTGCAHHWDPRCGDQAPMVDQNYETTVPGIYVVGDAASAEDSSVAMEQGRIAGLAAAHSLGYLPDAQFERLQVEARRNLVSPHFPLVGSGEPAIVLRGGGAERDSTVARTGVLDAADLDGQPGVPSEQRMRRGPVAVMECAQRVPCNSCETNCRLGAVTLNGAFTSLPSLNEEKCTGCGVCVPLCPGQAIFLIDLDYAPGEAAVTFPYEFLPLPEVGDQVQGTDREGKSVVLGQVVEVDVQPRYDDTALVTIAVPAEYAQIVRGIARLMDSHGRSREMNTEPINALLRMKGAE